ncbi:cytochrome c oxidase subunit 1 [Thoreauomyces humboldtii]|nr:cytochrome c oxidase subunit 1 [Thoreauomyces humboldtii]
MGGFYSCNAGDAGDTVEDMTTLAELSEAAIMDNLKARYDLKLIYTYTGSILVAMNPFERMEIYNMNILKRYMQKRHNENEPHIFAIAEAAYSNVRNTKINQSVIISGESGAGKSESTKVILQYLTTVTSKESQESWVEQQILEANTVLESFGNAKTIRNNNSSRFGKFIQVNFNRNSQIIGASIINYLLEKSRIAKQAPEERNYHIFYELVAGVNEEERARYQLEPADSYFYLNQTGCIDIPYVDDSQNFGDLKLALTVLKMTPADQDGLFAALSAILAVGNVEFSEIGGTESVQVANPESIAKVAALLGIDGEILKKAFCFKKLVIRGETSLVPYKLQQAKDTRDSFAKAVYDNIFQRLVEFINKSLTPKEKPVNFVGVLDIFGFEVFKFNSFEQFCINYTNEKLQSFFNQFIFKLEQEEYDKENIKWDKIEFSDNAQCLELIESKPAGILSLLDEETKFPKGTDESWLSKLDTSHIKHPFYIKARTQKGVFGVRHYAGEVTYTVASFLDKNRDAIQDELYDVVRQSTVAYVAKIFPKEEKDDQPGKGPRAGKTTAGTQFKNQLVSLVTTLGATTPHYVRCIKPNQSKEAFMFDDEMVISQLRYSGMLDTIRIRKAGYSMRLAFDGFVRDFKCLIPPGMNGKKEDPKKVAAAIAAEADLPQNAWQCGKTKFFLKQDGYAQLQDKVAAVLRAKVILIQKTMLGHLRRQEFLRKRKAARLLERYMLGFLCKRKYKRTLRATIKIQAVSRGWFARDYYRRLLADKRAADQKLAEKREAERKASNAPVNGALELTAPGVRRASFSVQPKSAPSREDGFKLPQAPILPPAPKLVIKKPSDLPPAPLLPLGQAPILSPAPKLSAIPASPIVAETPTKKKQSGEIDNLFAFLGDFDASKRSGVFRGADILAEMAAAITADIDSMFDEPISNAKAGLAKSALPAVAAVKGSVHSLAKDSQQSIAGDEQSSRGQSQMELQDESVRESAESVASVARRESVGKVMQHNPIMKELDVKRSNESIDKIDLNAKELSMESYAEKHFEQHYKASGFATIAKKRQLMDLSELLTYSKNPLQMSITKIPNKSDALDQMAVDCFKSLQKATELGGKRPEELAQTFLAQGITHPELRDELYVQLIKQVTVPAGKENIPKGWDQIQLGAWHVLVLACATFPPSKIFCKFLLAFLQRTELQLATAEKNPVRKLAIAAERAVRRLIMNGPRKAAPSLFEITTLKGNGVLPCRFGLLDGRELDIAVGLTTTAGDIVKDMARKVELKDQTGWSLYEVSSHGEKAAKATDYIADFIASWEKETLKKKGETIKKKKGETSIAAAVTLDASLVLKKRVFRDNKDEPLEPVEYGLLYAQAVDSISKDVYPISERVAMELAALRAQVLLGDCDPRAAESRLINELQLWVAPRLIPKQPREAWVQGIVKYYQKLQGTSTAVAKSLYLENVRSFKHYGASLFAVTHKGSWSFGDDVLLAVSQAGIDFMHPRTCDNLMTFPYRDVKSYEQENGLFTFAAVPASDDSGVESTEVFQFSTEQAEEIVILIREYCPTTEYMRKAKEPVFEVDVGTLMRDVEKARAALLDHGMMRKPGPDGVGKKAKGGIRRLFTAASRATVKSSAGMEGMLDRPNLERRGSTSSKAEEPGRSDEGISRQSSGGGGLTLRRSPSTAGPASPGVPDERNDEDYCVADWSFSTRQLATSLLAMSDTSLETWAAETSAILHSYLGPAGGPPPDVATFNLGALQGVFEKCLGSPYLANELYLQLVKQTTNHPDADSLPAINSWKLLVIACGVLAPSGWVLEYTKAHLRRCSVVDLRAKKPRTEEAQHSRHCLRTLRRTIGAGVRKLPPSADEILQATKLTPMRIRFHTMDGKSYTVPIEPSDSSDVVFHAVLEKMKVQALAGFTIYEQSGSSERALAKEEKITDCLYRSEKKRAQQPTTPRVQFLLKRKLFLRPMENCRTEAEDGLTRAQALHDVGSGAYPASEDDAIRLTALWAQAQYGDFSYDAPVQYAQLCGTFVPAQFRVGGIDKKVGEKHMEFLGTSPAQANAEISQLIRSWPLYGSTMFNVEQSTNKNIPSGCWLAVAAESIHILARNSKKPLFSHSYEDVVSFSPSLNSLLLVIGNNSSGQKYIFNTVQATQVADLMREYISFITPSGRPAMGTSTASRSDLRGPHPAASRSDLRGSHNALNRS